MRPLESFSELSQFSNSTRRIAAGSLTTAARPIERPDATTGCSKCAAVQASRGFLASTRRRAIGPSASAAVPALADETPREYRAQRTPRPIDQHCPRHRTTGLAVEFHYPQSWLWNTGTSRRFQLFFRCKEKPIFANSGVFARDKPSKSSDRQIMANPRGCLALAVHRQCRAFAACDPFHTGAHRRVAGRRPRRKDQDRRLRRPPLGGGGMGGAARRHRQRNPDPKLRNRPTLGMPILIDMAPTKPNKWEGQCLQLAER